MNMMNRCTRTRTSTFQPLDREKFKRRPTMMNRCTRTVLPMSEAQIATATVMEDHTMQKKHEEQEPKRLWGQKEQERLVRVTREKETQKQRKQKEAEQLRKQDEAQQLKKQLEVRQLRTYQEAKQLRKQKEAECVQRIAKEKVAESAQKQGEQEAQYNKEAKDLKPDVHGNRLWKKREVTKQLDERSHELLSKGKILQRNRVRPQQTTESPNKIPDKGQKPSKPPSLKTAYPL